MLNLANDTEILGLSQKIDRSGIINGRKARKTNAQLITKRVLCINLKFVLHLLAIIVGWICIRREVKCKGSQDAAKCDVIYA